MRRAATIASADLEGDRASVLHQRDVGHLQRNEAKDVVRVGAVVETVDSARLAAALAKRAAAAGRKLEVIAQVNVGGEASKSGCAPEEVGALVWALRSTRRVWA